MKTHRFPPRGDGLRETAVAPGLGFGGTEGFESPFGDTITVTAGLNLHGVCFGNLTFGMPGADTFTGKSLLRWTRVGAPG